MFFEHLTDRNIHAEYGLFDDKTLSV